MDVICDFYYIQQWTGAINSGETSKAFVLHISVVIITLHYIEKLHTVYLKLYKPKL